MGTFSVLELILNLGYCYCPADCRPPEISHQSENKTLSDLNTQPSHQTLFLKLKLVNYKFSCNSSESLFMLKDLRPDQISIDNTAPPTQLELPLDLLKKKQPGTHLDNCQPVRSVSVRVPGVNLHCNLVLPAQLLHLLPGRVRAGQQELDAHPGDEALPGRCWPGVGPGVGGEEGGGGGGGGGRHPGVGLTDRSEAVHQTVARLRGGQHRLLAVGGGEVLAGGVGGGVVGGGGGGEEGGGGEGEGGVGQGRECREHPDG